MNPWEKGAGKNCIPSEDNPRRKKSRVYFFLRLEKKNKFRKSVGRSPR
jgi:hypothetical protein